MPNLDIGLSVHVSSLGRPLMAYVKDSKSAAVRTQLDHPVIDGDGHWLEPVPIFLDYLRQAGGPSVVERFLHKACEGGWYEMGPQEPLGRRIHRPPWWGVAT